MKDVFLVQVDGGDGRLCDHEDVIAMFTVGMSAARRKQVSAFVGRAEPGEALVIQTQTHSVGVVVRLGERPKDVIELTAAEIQAWNAAANHE